MKKFKCPNCNGIMEKGYYNNYVCNCLGGCNTLKTINEKINLINKYNYDIIILSGSISKINYLLKQLKIKRNHIYEAKAISDSNNLINIYKEHHVGQCIFIKNINGKYSFGTFPRDYKIMNLDIEKIADEDIFQIIIKNNPLNS